jgi:hypothetical protein
LNVYNLTDKDLLFHKKSIPPNGGSQNYPELDPPKGFIPDRDRELEKKKVVAFGTLPYWWKLQQSVKKGPLTRAQVEARDDIRIEKLEKQIKEGGNPHIAIVSVMAGKIADELKVESQARAMMPAVPVPEKDKGKRK